MTGHGRADQAGQTVSDRSTQYHQHWTSGTPSSAAEGTPDILCLGKALTGGYISLAASLTTRNIAETISRGDPGVFMHGPTFIANPLICTPGLTSLRLLLDSPWQERIRTIEQGLENGLAPCQSFTNVADIRLLGAIGVVELNHPVGMETVQPRFVDAGVWVRPFGKLVYLMPRFIIDESNQRPLTSVACEAA